MNVVYFETKKFYYRNRLIYTLMEVKNNKMLFSTKGVNLLFTIVFFIKQYH